MNDVEYELLAWLEAGHSVFRPVGGTGSAKQEFQDTVAHLLALRERGLVQFPDGLIGRSEAGGISRGWPLRPDAGGPLGPRA